MLYQRPVLTLTPWDREHNPYLVEYVAVMTRYQEEKERWRASDHKIQISDDVLPFAARDRLVQQYSFGIPNEDALRAIQRWSANGVLEVGAGTGYWAKLLAELGVDVRACDPVTTVYKNPEGVEALLEPIHFPVEKRSGVEALQEDGHSRTLLLCWPDIQDWPAQTLEAYQGGTVVYVGEGDGGHTGEQRFHKLLADWWERKEECAIPQWEGVYDYLMVFQRK